MSSLQPTTQGLAADPGALNALQYGAAREGDGGKGALKEAAKQCDSDYLKVKNFFKEKSSLLPFSVLETYKPILASSTLTQSEMPCDGATAMEQVIMSAAKESKKKIKGLETMAEQAGFLDSIPYKYQAEELVKYIDSSTVSSGDDKMMNAMFEAYRQQDLKKLEELMVDSDAGLSSFTNILLYNRNANWVGKLKTLMTEKSLLVAVGAGHLPGGKGVINLLKKEGYTVTPVKNKLKKVKRDIDNEPFMLIHYMNPCSPIVTLLN